MKTDRIRLTGLDGSNPLGFLAALGALRLLSRHPPARAVRMAWVAGPEWQPELVGADCAPGSLAAAILAHPAAPVAALLKQIGPNLTVSPASYRKVAEDAADDRDLADFVAAFGSEAVSDGKKTPRIRYTELCFITGSGHQDFLKTADKLRSQVTAEDIDAALFGPWQRKKLKGMSFRWDPSDAAEYALQWGDPSAEGASTVPGANWLAFEALPCFPTHPTGPRSLRTTAFRPSGRGQDPQFRWPLWERPISLPALRSLLAASALTAAEPGSDDLADLAARGVARIYSATKVRIGQGANFKVNFRPATALL